MESGTLHYYLKRYQQEPNSRVFAPLAECYRKAGLFAEAEEIARDGVEAHPQFMGGRVALARVLFDQEKFDEVLAILQPVLVNVPDNLVAQRLVAEAALLLNRLSEALLAYKMILYFCPEDREVAELVRELETAELLYQERRMPEAAVVEQAAPLFAEQAMDKVLEQAPEARQRQRGRQIELLRQLSQKVERYRLIRDIGRLAGTPRN